MYSRNFFGEDDVSIPSSRMSKRQRRKLSSHTVAMPVESPRSLYLKADINQTSAMCLVDTGCSRCLISESLYNRLKRKPQLGHTRFKFLMAQSSMESKGVCHLEVCFAGKHFSQFFFVVPMANFDCILGLDFLVENDISLRPSTMSLYLPEGREVLLHSSKLYQDMAVKLCDKVKLEPNETKQVRVSCSGNTEKSTTPDDSYYCAMADELWSRFGVIVYEGVIRKNRSNTFDLAFHNPSPGNVTINGGATVGFLESYKATTDLPNVDPRNKESLSETDRNIIMAMETVCERHFEDEALFEEELDIVTPPDSSTPPQLSDTWPSYIAKTMLSDSKSTLTKEQYQTAERLLVNYSDRFHPPDAKLSRTDAVEHYIELKEGHERPLKCPPRRIPPGRKQMVEQEVEKMLKNDIISPSSGPWASPIVLVSKKDNTVRFCVDYRKLNRATKLDAYPLARIDDCIDALQGAKYFCTLDLASGYWQIKVAESDREKTAFTSHLGLFKFNVMPFGLTNAPATFQRMMDGVLSGLINRICLCYIDDIIVYGKTMEELTANLDEVLLRLRQHNLLLKPKKCKFFQTSVAFLGHIISGDGVKCDPEKCEKIRNWEPPRNIGEVRSFLGLVGYYRRFIDNYSNKAKPLLQLTRKDVMFKWGPAHDEAFQSLKDALCSDPILAYPRDDLPWILDTDASNYAVGAVLSQRHPDGKERVVSYGSKVLNDSQRNYCTTKRELFAVIFFVTSKYSYYLTQRPFTLRTDHKALKWLIDGESHDAMCNRWITKLSPFKPFMSIVHRAGTKHCNADSMSRLIDRRTCDRPDCEDCVIRKARKKMDKQSEETLTAGSNYADHVASMTSFIDGFTDLETMKESVRKEYVAAAGAAQAQQDETTNYTLPRYSEKDIVEAQSNDDAIARIKQLILQYGHNKPESKKLRSEVSEVKLYCKVWHSLSVERNILFRTDPQSGKPKLVIPHALRKEILDELHNKPCGGHLGITRVRAAIKQRFYWPRMRADIERWCKCCRTCTLNKKGPSRGKSPLVQDLVASVWERVAFDVIGPLKQTARGNRFILTVVDYFSKWVEAYPLPEHTAKTVAWTIVTEWVARYGVPLYMHCDQAPEFESKVMADFCKMLGITKTRTSPYHPSGNGLAERSNQMLESILKCTVNENKDNWDEKISFGLMAYRATPSATTGCSPNLLAHGRETTLPIDIMYGGIAPPERRHGVYRCYCDYVHDLQESMAAAFQRAKACSKVAAERQKRYYDIGAEYKKFYPGQFVLWMHKPTAAKSLTSGWRPLVVTKVLSKVDVQCQESPTSRPITIHMDQLIPDPYKPHRTNWVKEALAQRNHEVVNRAQPQPVKVVDRARLSTKRVTKTQPGVSGVDMGNDTHANKHPIADLTDDSDQASEDAGTNPDDLNDSSDSNDLSRDEQLSMEVSHEGPAQRRPGIIQSDSKSSRNVSWKDPLVEVKQCRHSGDPPTAPVTRTRCGRALTKPKWQSDIDMSASCVCYE